MWSYHLCMFLNGVEKYEIMLLPSWWYKIDRCFCLLRMYSWKSRNRERVSGYQSKGYFIYLMISFKLSLNLFLLLSFFFNNNTYCLELDISEPNCKEYNTIYMFMCISLKLYISISFITNGQEKMRKNNCKQHTPLNL